MRMIGTGVLRDLVTQMRDIKISWMVISLMLLKLNSIIFEQSVLFSDGTNDEIKLKHEHQGVLCYRLIRLKGGYIIRIHLSYMFDFQILMRTYRILNKID